MPRIAVSVRDAEPNPALVIALRRATGGHVGEIAAAVFNGTPLYDEDVFDTSEEDPVGKLERLLAVLRVTALQVVILDDGREIGENQLYDYIRIWRTASPRTRQAG